MSCSACIFEIRLWMANDYRLRITSCLFLLGRFSLHHGEPIASIPCDGDGHSIGRGRKYLYRDPCLRPGSARLLFPGPGPGMAFRTPGGVLEFSYAIELVVGVDILFGVKSQVGDAGTAGHASTLERRLNDQKEPAIHPVVVLGHGESTARPHGTGLDYAFQGPVAHQILQLL